MPPPNLALDQVLAIVAGLSDAASAAVFVVGDGPEDLELAASYELPEPAATALAPAVRNPQHPIARTASTSVAGYDVRPTAPGGPALRTHLPLVSRRDGSSQVVGVLALSHEEPIPVHVRAVLEGGAQLLAAIIDRRP